jgi:hypothetical protein
MPSLIEQFIRNQEQIRGDKAASKSNADGSRGDEGETRKFEEQLNAAFGDGSYW